MKRVIETEIVINSSKENIWNILMDNAKYEKWNPFIISSEGEIKRHNRISNTIKTESKLMKFKPIITELKNQEYFEWLGTVFISGIFNGRHSFELKELDTNKVLLIHKEIFTGILSPMFFPKIERETTEMFIKMNNAIKKRAEEQRRGTNKLFSSELNS